MKETLKAIISLTLICAAVCGLLAYGNELTKDKIAQTEERTFQKSLVSAFGEGNYTVAETLYEGINQVILDDKGRVFFDVTSTGYQKDSQRLLVGIDANGTVCGISFVTFSDSPTQAAKIQADTFVSQFIGLDEASEEFDAVSGATRSSEGVHAAVSLALNTYHQHKEELIHG